jgi:transcriptional regulator with XRE-family HTH domain
LEKGVKSADEFLIHSLIHSFLEYRPSRERSTTKIGIMIKPYSNFEFQFMKDEDFFSELGERIADLRLMAGLTQAELAERLGLRQQVVATYENATRRLPSSLVLPLCEIFGITLDQLFGVEQPKAKPGPVPKVYKQFRAICDLPKSKQDHIARVIDALLAQEGTAA